jgi:Uncharacterized ACR, COG1430
LRAVRCRFFDGTVVALSKVKSSDEKALNLILALNETRKTLLASRLHVLGKEAIARGEYVQEIRPGDGLWLEPCEGIDTRRLRAPIDLVFVDASHRVLAVMDLLRTRSEHLLIPGAVAILALASGTIRLSQTREGDHIALDPIAPQVDAEPPVARLPRF